MPLLTRIRSIRPAPLLAASAWALRPAAAAAHAGEPLAPHDLATAWSLEPFVVLPMALSLVLYLRGVRRLRRAGAPEYGRGSMRVRAFVAGWIWLAVALVSPVDALGGVLFSGHMLQHEILMLLAAPLLVAGRPFVPFLWGLPAGWGRSAGPILRAQSARRVWAWLTLPLVAWALHGAALWLWHIPALFEATVTDDLVHAAQHASFFGTALIFWWALLGDRNAPAHYGVALIYVFTTAVHSSILGALLTFAPTVWYPVYSTTTPAWGLTPLEDQQLGGLIMWVPAGVVYAVCGLYLFAGWIRESPRPRTGGGSLPRMSA
jgi:putative membrane protein